MKKLSPILNSLRGTNKPAAGMVNKSFDYAGGKIEVQFCNEDSEPAIIQILDSIGEDPWDGSGVTEKSVRSALAVVPRNKEISLIVNSRGGDVYQGFGIKNAIEEWPNKVTATITGVAASTASWMILGADEVRAPKASQIYVHDAMTFTFGNAADHDAASEKLETTSAQISEMYSDKTGKSINEMRDLMRASNGAGTLLTGSKAKELGLVDVLTDEKPVFNFTDAHLNSMRKQLGALKNQSGFPQHKQNKVMNRTQLEALLNKWGVKFKTEATDDELVNLVNAGPPVSIPAPAPSNVVPATDATARIAELENTVKTLTTADAESKRIRISEAVNKLIENDQLPAAMKDKAISRCIKDESYLDELKGMPSRPPGSNPVGPSSEISLTSENVMDVQKHILENTVKFRDQFIGTNAALYESMDKTDRLRVAMEISNRAKAAAIVINKYKDKIVQMWNSNAIDAALQRQVILQEMLEAYAVVIMRLDIFSTVFSNVPLEGLDTIEVPYFPLQTTASNSFVKTTGYDTASDWTQSKREIPVGGDGVAGTSGANATAGTARDRKYQMINFTSYDLRRQPYLNLVKLFVQAANKLGVDIFTDIISRTMTRANFGVPAKIQTAAAFSGSDVADLRNTATGLNWPNMGRSLVLDHNYYTSLLKDPDFKHQYSYGSSDPIQRGRIQNAYGFDDLYEVPNLTNYSPAGESLSGWINHKSGLLIAFSPIMPSPEVLALLSRYDVIVDPKTGIAFEYRRFGNVVLDKSQEVVESSYGAAKGVETAVQLLAAA